MFERLKKDRWLLAVLVITVVFAAYWLKFSANAYGTFHEYDDLGLSAQNMYIDLNYPGLVHGLQLLVFGAHIAPDQLLLLPIFYLDQSALTLLVLQVIVISLTALAVFLVTRKLLGSARFGFLFFLAFILNPGVRGLLVFDYHAEAFIMLFYLLTFYFYVRLNKPLFFASLLLLLGTIEEAPFLAATLGVGLLLYEYFYAEKGSSSRSQKIKLAIIMIALSAIVYFAYSAITISLTHAYATSAYASMPVYLAVNTQTSGLFTTLAANSGGIGSSLSMLGNGYVLYGLAVALLIFGIAILFDPIITLVLASPFLVESILAQNFSFFFVWYQYFSYILGGIFVGAILGMMKAQKKRGQLAKLFERNFKNYDRAVAYSVAASVVAVALVLTLLYPSFIYSKNVNNLSQDFLFQVNSTQRAYYAQIDSLLQLVPGNASLAVPFFVTPHVANREYLEDTGFVMENWYFRPEYILVDLNLNVSLNAYAGVGGLINYTRNNTYDIYARNGTAILLRFNNSQPPSAS